MKTETYNGWTNYATWRVNLELWAGYETESPVSPEFVEETSQEYMNPDGEESIRVDYANAFMSDVNWDEIAEAINDGVEEEED